MESLEHYLAEGVDYKKAVVCYVVTEERVLLGVRRKVSQELGQDLIAGIGGKKEQKQGEIETDEEALVRELEEETGITLLSYQRRGRVRFIFPHKQEWNQDVSIFIATEWEGEPQEIESIEPRWYPIEELPKSQMWEDNLYWVPKVLAGETVDVIFLYDENNKVAEYRFL